MYAEPLKIYDKAYKVVLRRHYVFNSASMERDRGTAKQPWHPLLHVAGVVVAVLNQSQIAPRTRILKGRVLNSRIDELKEAFADMIW
jgi:hypothetical protein